MRPVRPGPSGVRAAVIVSGRRPYALWYATGLSRGLRAMRSSRDSFIDSRHHHANYATAGAAIAAARKLLGAPLRQALGEPVAVWIDTTDHDGPLAPVRRVWFGVRPGYVLPGEHPDEIVRACPHGCGPLADGGSGGAEGDHDICPKCGDEWPVKS